MLKTFLVGLLLGFAGAAASLYAFPLIDQYREASIVSVAANGGNNETFHVNVPMDRILLGGSEPMQSVPEGMQWPNDRVLDGIRAEIFKIRNSRNTVVGIASRVAASKDSGGLVDWVLHLPARGSMFANLRPEANAEGSRAGELRAGSREFSKMNGAMTERWIPNTSGDEDDPIGRIELLTTYKRMQESP